MGAFRWVLVDRVKGDVEVQGKMENLDMPLYDKGQRKCSLHEYYKLRQRSPRPRCESQYDKLFFDLERTLLLGLVRPLRDILCRQLIYTCSLFLFCTSSHSPCCTPDWAPAKGRVVNPRKF